MLVLGWEEGGDEGRIVCLFVFFYACLFVARVACIANKGLIQSVGLGCWPVVVGGMVGGC